MLLGIKWWHKQQYLQMVQNQTNSSSFVTETQIQIKIFKTSKHEICLLTCNDLCYVIYREITYSNVKNHFFI